jgi:hypothetical protein
MTLHCPTKSAAKQVDSLARQRFTEMVEKAGPLPSSALASNERLPIVIEIPGAQLMSTKGSGANRRGERHLTAKEKALHRDGANGVVAKRLGQEPGYVAFLARRKKKPCAYWTVTGRIGPFPVTRILFTRICPRRHFCDPGGNLATLFKATEDGTADALGRDDALFEPTDPRLPVQSGKIGVWYEQIDGPWGVRITIV